MKKSGTMRKLNFILTILTIFMVACSSCAQTSDEPDGNKEGINESAEPMDRSVSVFGEISIAYLEGAALPASAETVLLDFLKTSYEAQAELLEPELLPYFDMGREESQKNAFINQLALSYLVEVRKDHELDLSLVGYDSIIEVTRAEETGLGIWEVGLLEHSRVNYAFIPEVDTYASGVEHELVLEYIGGRWKITFHSKEEDVYYLAELALEEEEKSDEEEIEGEVEEEYREEVSWESKYEDMRIILMDYAKNSIERTEEARRTFLADPEDSGNRELVWEFDYDRRAAVDYSYKWIGETEWLRNPDWVAYDERGGNCNNFISQCLYAGGIPMDAKGHVESQWKWLDDYISSRETLTGRTPSWCGVDEFYDYALQNEGPGLVAQVGANIYSGQIGDIIQYGARGDWNHSVIIVDVIRDDRGQIVDYLINSNTTDRIDCPMSAYAYTDIRLIRILGYNGMEEGGEK